jgi:hypothetical protein
VSAEILIIHLNKNEILRTLIFLSLFFLKLNTDARIINFAGRNWIVKSGYGGPGPNYWSDSEHSVWIDENGWLHLKIREVDGRWYCSEVYTEFPTQYGVHSFYVIGRLDSLDMNIIAAMFLYKDDSNEVDIEFTKWGSQNPGYNSQYAIQPWENPGNMVRFLMKLDGINTTHYFDWQPSEIKFKSIHEHYEHPPDSSYIIYDWQYIGDDNPTEERELKVHINFWLYQGEPPTDKKEVEIIIKDADLPLPKIQEEKPYKSCGCS